MEVLGALLAIASLYYLAALAALVRRWRRPHGRPPGNTPETGVSLLKPAMGAGPEFAVALQSFADQDRGQLQILVGAETGNRETLSAVDGVQSAHPDLAIRLVECAQASPGCNGKVEVLERLAGQARHPVWIMTDADIRVPRNYVRTLQAELAEPRTGLVTCLYAAEAGPGLPSRLQTVRVNTEFAAQVLLARWLQHPGFALGSTLAIRAETLQRAGGFEALRRVVGDDYHLGARIHALGLGVRISSVAVSTSLPRTEGWGETWRRELRWSRTIRKQRPAGHAALPVTFGSLWTCLAMVLDAQTLWPLAATCLALRLTTGAFSALRVGATGIAGSLALVPLADLWAAAAWTCSYFGSTVTWSGRLLRLGPGGRIRR